MGHRGVVLAWFAALAACGAGGPRDRATHGDGGSGTVRTSDAGANPAPFDAASPMVIHDASIDAILDSAVLVAGDFSEPVAVARTEGNAKVPGIAITTDGVVHIVWHDFTSEPPTLYYASGGAGDFAAARLDLIEGRQTFPALLAIGTHLHLVFEHGDAAAPTLTHAMHDGEQWSTPEPIAVGKRVRLARGPDDSIHALYFAEGRPAHHIYDGEWRTGNSIEIEHRYINSIRLAATGTAAGVELAVASSPGGTGYDIRRWSWTAEAGWSALTTLFTSLDLGSDDLGGASDPEGIAHWVWTEQDPADVWTTGIVTRSSRHEPLTWIARDPGFPVHPTIAVPPDGRSIVAWAQGDETIAVARAPYDQIQHVGGTRALGPQLAVDPDGFTHLVYYGEDEARIQQVFYSNNRP